MTTNGNGTTRTFTPVNPDAEIVKFDNIGDTLEATLTGKRIVKRKDGTPAVLWDFTLDSGKQVAVWGTKYLDQRLDAILPGSYVQIQYAGDAPAKQKGYSPMRIFNVGVAQ
ncbi:hypothetical protein LLG88_00355 [bacterium]|nr:hypothetical protein [bacterium]